MIFGVTNFETRPSIILVSLNILKTVVDMFKPYEDDAQKLQELLITSSLFPKYCWAEAEKNPDELRFGTGNPKLTSDVVFTLPETDSSPLKMDGFNTTFLLGFGLFSGAFDLLLVSGRVGLVQKNVT